VGKLYTNKFITTLQVLETEEKILWDWNVVNCPKFDIFIHNHIEYMLYIHDLEPKMKKGAQYSTWVPNIILVFHNTN
jgi:hypothetical protein